MTELFDAHHREFSLSESPLWQRVCKEARNHPETLGATAG